MPRCSLSPGRHAPGDVRILVGRALAVALALAVVSGCAPKRQAQASRPFVQTSVATAGAIYPASQLPGIVAPYQNVAIQSTLSEPADNINVSEGDRIARGEVLAVLDTADLQATLQSDMATAASAHANTAHTTYQGGLTIVQGVQSLNSAQAAVQQAQATYDNDSTTLKRDQQLLTNGYIAMQTVDQMSTQVHNDQQALQSAQATLASAKANVQANGQLTSGGLQQSSVDQAKAAESVALANAKQVKVQIAKATIVSPIDGVVVNRNLNPGEYPGTRQIFTLQQIDPIYAILRGSGQQIAKIPTGAAATIAASDLGGRKFTGRVVGVLNQIVPGSTDFQVKVRLDNPGGTLRPGMAILGRVSLPPVNGVRVPVTAFTNDNHNAIMTVSDDGTVRTMHVVELAEDITSAVVSGIDSGSRVVRDGQSSVGDGEKVAVK